MWLLQLPISRCWWLVPLIAMIWSGFQAHAGYHYGLFIYDSNIKDEKDRDDRVRLLAYAVPHAALYFIATATGFAAWALLAAISTRIADFSQISGGTGTLLVALGTLTVLGVSGALAPILWRGGKIV